MAKINTNCPTLNPNCNNTINCNCLVGTPHVVNGQCLCDNGTTNTSGIPPMPITLPPVGYKWVYSAAAGRWIPELLTTPVISNNPIDNIAIPTFITKAKHWAQENPMLAIGLGISAYVAFFKKS